MFTKPLQQFQYLLMEAVYASDVNFHIVAPNLSISATTWRPCELSHPAFLAEVSKALQAYYRYKGNSWLLIDEATPFDFGMQMAYRSVDENGVTQISEVEKEGCINDLWFQKRDESTLDQSTFFQNSIKTSQLHA